MLPNYLDRSFHVSMIISLLVFGLAGVGWIFLPLMLFYGSTLWIFRRKASPYRENVVNRAEGMIYAPVNARIISVRDNVNHVIFGKNLKEVQLGIPWWSEAGIYLPIKSEIKDFQSKDGKSIFRFKTDAIPDQSSMSVAGVCLSLETNKKQFIGMQFIKCMLGQWPELIVMPGDRGKERANIGFFPFGGTVLMFLPENFDVVINKDNEVIAGETVIAKDLQAIA